MLLSKDICEACIAVDLPRDLAFRLVEKLKSGGQRFLCSVSNKVAIYLYADPGASHEQIISDVKNVIKQSSDRPPGEVV